MLIPGSWDPGSHLACRHLRATNVSPKSVPDTIRVCFFSQAMNLCGPHFGGGEVCLLSTDNRPVPVSSQQGRFSEHMLHVCIGHAALRRISVTSDLVLPGQLFSFSERAERNGYSETAKLGVPFVMASPGFGHHCIREIPAAAAPQGDRKKD